MVTRYYQNYTTCYVTAFIYQAFAKILVVLDMSTIASLEFSARLGLEQL